MTRPTWAEYALGLAKAASSRSEDPFVKVGAVVLRRDRSVASVGYNGAPSGIELDWSDREKRRVFVIHAEVNALRYVVASQVRHGFMAVTGIPCPSCLTSIAAHGIQEVVYARPLENYPAEASYEVARVLGLRLWTPKEPS